MSDSLRGTYGWCQVALSMGLSRQEHWNGLPFPLPGDLPDPGIEPRCLASPTLAGRFFTSAPPGKSQFNARSLLTISLVRSRSCTFFFFLNGISDDARNNLNKRLYLYCRGAQVAQW